MKRIAVLGLGIMGSRMAMNLVQAGHQVTVYNRSKERAEPLVDAGAVFARTPRDAAEQADIIISIVSNNEASEAIWLHEEYGALYGLCRGKIAIESSTLTPRHVKELAAKLTESGANFLEAPVVGSKPHVEKGELIYLVGGDPVVLNEVRCVLEVNAIKIHHLGQVGAATVMKLAVNALMGIQVAAYSEMLGMLVKSGIDERKASELLLSLPVASPVIQRFAPLVQSRMFLPNFPLKHAGKDLGYALDAATAVGAPAPTTAAVKEVFASAVRQEFGEDDICGLSQLFLD
jgi:3-hydroxyisobutyrate dehydrogenase-like beta-hydroxyacid dehydrogenase